MTNGKLVVVIGVLTAILLVAPAKAQEKPVISTSLNHLPPMMSKITLGSIQKSTPTLTQSVVLSVATVIPIPNAYRADNSVPMPIVELPDNSVPIPNAYLRTPAKLNFGTSFAVPVK